jgi:hypothetical protein
MKYGCKFTCFIDRPHFQLGSNISHKSSHFCPNKDVSLDFLLSRSWEVDFGPLVRRRIPILDRLRDGRSHVQAPMLPQINER